MNWLDVGIWTGVVGFALFIIATVMNLVWGDEDDRKEAQTTLVSLFFGCIMVVGGVLIMTFVVKPALVIIANAVWTVF